MAKALKLREAKRTLKQTSGEVLREVAFFGVVHNHFETIAEDVVPFTSKAIIDSRNLSRMRRAHYELRSLLKDMEVMIRDVTGTALSPEQSSLYEAKFKILHEKYTNLIRNIPAQTQIRTNLLSAINAHLSTIEEHKKLIRKSTYRGVRFGKRVRKHAERLKNVLDYLTRDVSNRIDTIKAARLNMKK